MGEAQKKVASIDENWICRIKKNCIDCLSLTHCVWCNSTNVQGCYSPTLQKDFCPNNIVNSMDHGCKLRCHGKLI